MVKHVESAGIPKTGTFSYFRTLLGSDANSWISRIRQSPPIRGHLDYDHNPSIPGSHRCANISAHVARSEHPTIYRSHTPILDISDGSQNDVSRHSQYGSEVISPFHPRKSGGLGLIMCHTSCGYHAWRLLVRIWNLHFWTCEEGFRA